VSFREGVCPWTPLGDFCPPDTMWPRPPTSKSWLRHCTLGQTQLTGFTQRSANEFLDLVTSLLKYSFVLTDYRNVSANLVVFGTVFGKKKIGEDRTCSCEDMIVDRLTHTDTLTDGLLQTGGLCRKLELGCLCWKWNTVHSKNNGARLFTAPVLITSMEFKSSTWRSNWNLQIAY